MRALLARVGRTIRQDCRIETGDRVAVAVSGGADSVALAWLLGELAARDRGPVVAGLIHLNHQLRGAESDADEAFVRDVAARLDVPAAAAGVDVGARARDAHVSIEVAAREARYEFFETAASSLGATLVATGHTIDDQAETVLLRLLRGAGTRGLSGIRARRDRIIRPLIHCRRADLRTFLRSRGERWREDATNEDVSILRNRIRHELMPVLSGIAPGGVRALARLAALAQDDEAALMSAATEFGSSLVLSNGAGDGRVEVDAAMLSLMPAALARRLIRACAADIAPGRQLAARHLEAVRSLAASDKLVGHLDLPGVVVAKRDGRLVLTPVASAPAC
jgi:tRNA(Ile)-lysidine synthase